VPSGPRDSVCLSFLDAREVDWTDSRHARSTCIKKTAPRNAPGAEPGYGDTITLFGRSFARLQFSYEHVADPPLSSGV